MTDQNEFDLGELNGFLHALREARAKEKEAKAEADKWKSAGDQLQELLVNALTTNEVPADEKGKRDWYGTDAGGKRMLHVSRYYQRQFRTEDFRTNYPVLADQYTDQKERTRVTVYGD